VAGGVEHARDVAADVGGQEVVEEQPDVEVGAGLPERDPDPGHVEQAVPLVGPDQVAEHQQQRRGRQPFAARVPQ